MKRKGFERQNIAQLAGYVPGEQRSDVAVIKLNTNESPYPTSPKVQDAIATVGIESLRRYPQPTADRFRSTAASVHQVAIENVIATRGGDELLRLLLTTYVDPGACVGMTDPTYSLYPVLTAIQDAKVVSIPLEADWSLPQNFSSQINANHCQLTFIVNPHAPSGRLIGQAALQVLASEIEGILVIDEAYVDFVSDEDHDLTQWAIASDNIVLLRTLSKGYGLAGLRVGYGIGPVHLIEPMLHKTRDSYNLDAISQQLADVALGDQAYAKSVWAKVRASRNDLKRALQDLGLAVSASESNFLLATVPSECALSAEALYEGLKAAHILVRYFADDRLKDKLRITIGTPQENAQLLAQLTALLQGGQSTASR
jgi:histidinol-phosphate aminotransferase|tara:strand:- start:226 stop:1335 length:1110 start_codon:yes stop_codon:yes gene_type:complete